MSRLILFNKPFGVLTQFTSGQGRATLADYLPVPGVYPAGRLDMDSEGLVVLTDDGALQAEIADPKYKLAKRYFAQTEGVPTEAALRWLERGVDLEEFVSKPRMTAKVGFPTLRLIRWSVGIWNLDGLAPGQWRELEISRQPDVPQRVIRPNAPKNRGVNSSLPIHKRKETP